MSLSQCISSIVYVTSTSYNEGFSYTNADRPISYHWVTYIIDEDYLKVMFIHA